MNIEVRDLRLRFGDVAALDGSPLALAPVGLAQLPLTSPQALRIAGPLLALMVVVPLLFLLMRTMPVRPKKA